MENGKISIKEHDQLMQFIKVSYDQVKDGAKDQIEELIDIFLKSKSSVDIKFDDISSKFKKVYKNVINQLGEASSEKSAVDILKYSLSYNKLLDSIKIRKEHVKSLAYKYGVGVVSTMITAAELWNDFNYDLNTIEMSQEEALLNTITDIGAIGAAKAGVSLSKPFATFLSGSKIYVLKLIPVAGWYIIGATAAVYLYEKHLKDPIKGELREFKDWCEQQSW